MELAIVSDTHIPSRATGIPPWIRERIGGADHTVHAGDFTSGATLETVRDLAGGELTAVGGNMDSLGLPTTTAVARGGVEFVVHHGTGDLDTYRERVARTVREYDAGDGSADTRVGVCGHTHEYIDETVDGVRLLNPGSATGADPAEETTMLTARVEEGSLDVSLHRE